MIVPVRWAVDGLDAMTWRGIGLSGALMPVAVLVGLRGGVLGDCRVALPLDRGLENVRIRWN